ncbi:winged helix-turn-helix transcriptional regulator [Quadrisphaera sp. KR29]|uniref:winged helix-turn-helix transcriptional regulator n=1 Tax=Quadrisphaera sp. KR29 TaxID=3461391 RepID=UPI00404482CF
MRDTDPGSAHHAFQISAPHRELLDQVLDRWSMDVLDALCRRPARFSELRRAIPAVTQKSLTATLRRLERNGVVERVVVSTRPVAVEYRITALGKTLRPPVEAVLGWAAAHMDEIQAARERFDEQVETVPPPVAPPPGWPAAG